MAPGDRPAAFHFVNVGDPTTAQIPSHGRAFVVSRARTRDAWSTKSDKAVDKRKGKKPRRATRATNSVGQPKRRSPGAASHVSHDPDHPAWASASALDFELDPADAQDALAYSSAAALRQSVRIQPGFGLESTPDSTIRLVLEYFASMIGPRLTPIAVRLDPDRIEKEWVLPSVGNSAFMHAFVGLTALRMAMANPHMHGYFAIAAKERLLAITEVKRNLNDPTLAVSNETIAAVYHLLCFEEALFLEAYKDMADGAMQPDSSQLKAHVIGLNKMIKLRGGIQGLDSYRGLQSFIIRHFLARSAVGLRSKILLEPGLMQDLFRYPESSPYYTESLQKASRWCQLGLHPELQAVLTCTDSLMKDTADWYRDPGSHRYNSLQIQTIYALNTDMFVRFHYAYRSSMSGADYLISLFTAVVGYYIGGDGHMLQQVPIPMSNIQDAFEGPGVIYDLEAFGFNVWVTFMAAMSTQHLPEYASYFLHLHLDALASSIPKIQSFKDYLDHLSAIIWLPARFDPAAWKMWEDTAELRLSREQSGEEYQKKLEGLAYLPCRNPYLNTNIREGDGMGESPVIKAYNECM